MSEIGAPSAIGVPAQREPVEMTAALDEESDRVALRLAIDAAGVGAFVWDLVSGRLRWDERLLELFGLVGDADPRVLRARGRLASLLF